MLLRNNSLHEKDCLLGVEFRWNMRLIIDNSTNIYVIIYEKNPWLAVLFETKGYNLILGSNWLLNREDYKTFL